MNQMNEKTKCVDVQIVNAFVKDGEGGNPAGVVLDADNYSEDEKLQIAQKVGLSETAFVSQSDTEAFKLDFFTPAKRIPHCGHATIATFSYLDSVGRVEDGLSSKETVDGPRKIVMDKGMAYMEQLAPRYQQIDVQKVLDSLGLQNGDVDPGIEPMLVNTGNAFIVLGVRDAITLKNIQPDLGKIEQTSQDLDLVGYYIFTTETQELDAVARMFAPLYGIAEEAATGMAAGPLACLLWQSGAVDKTKLLIGQGDFMQEPSPSLIRVNLEIENGQITGLLAGGQGKVVRDIKISI